MWFWINVISRIIVGIRYDRGTCCRIAVGKIFRGIWILSPNNDVIKRMKISNDIIGM